MLTYKNLAIISYCHFKIVTLGQFLALRLVYEEIKRSVDIGSNVEI